MHFPGPLLRKEGKRNPKLEGTTHSRLFHASIKVNNVDFPMCGGAPQKTNPHSGSWCFKSFIFCSSSAVSGFIRTLLTSRRPINRALIHRRYCIVNCLSIPSWHELVHVNQLTYLSENQALHLRILHTPVACLLQLCRHIKEGRRFPMRSV